MIFITSHFTKNKGTTDYFCEFLEKNNTDYYYLRHPFVDPTLTDSELILFKSGQKTILTKIPIKNNFILNLINNFIATFRLSFKFKSKIDTFIGVGSFNTIPLLLTKILGFKSKKVIFYGVDYSRKRFGSWILNQFYFLTETFACLLTDKTVSVTERQNQARIYHHFLNPKKSVVIPNGIQEIDFNKSYDQYTKKAFVYIGSITHQHGIVDFVKAFHVDRNIDFNLHIFGGGPLDSELVNIINSLPESQKNKIKFYGIKQKLEIIRIIESLESKLFGIAPYSQSEDSDHVYYGDSLKLKEYLQLNMPFITTDIVYVDNVLKEFGFVYQNIQELESFLKDGINNFFLDINLKNRILEENFNNSNNLNKII